MKITLYTTKIKDTKHNTTFDKHMASYRDHKFEVILSDEAKKAIIRNNVDYPMEVELTESQYFLKKKNYVRNDGTKGSKYQIVIMAFNSATHIDFEKITLDSIVDKLDTASFPDEE